MTELEFDYDATPDQLEPVAPGLHDVEIVAAAIEPQSSNPQKLKIRVQAQLSDPESPEFKRKVTDNVPMPEAGNPKSWGGVRLKQILRSCGTVPPPGSKVSEIVENLVGQHGRVVIKHEVAKDKTNPMAEARTVARLQEWVPAK